jgi:hypothetical protein
MKCGRWRRERNEDIKTSLSNATERGYTVWGRKNGKIVLFEMQYGMCSSKLYFSFNSNFFSIS